MKQKTFFIVVISEERSGEKIKNFMKKSLLILAAVVIFGIAFFGVVSAFVGFPGADFSRFDDNQTLLIDRIVERFNLDKDEVSGVFEEFNLERQVEIRKEMRTREEEKLAKMVENGKITEEQKTIILAKHIDIQAKMEALKDLEPEQKQEEMKKLRDEMKTWLEENGLNDFRGFGGFMKFGHIGFMGHPGPRGF